MDIQTETVVPVASLDNLNPFCSGDSWHGRREGFFAPPPMTLVLCLATFLSALFCISAQTVHSAQGYTVGMPATFSADDICAELTSHLRAVHSIDVTYRTLPDPSREQAYTWVQVQQQVDLMALSIRHGSQMIPHQDDPFSVRYLVYDRLFAREEPFNRKMVTQDIESDAVLPGSLAGEFWCNATGIWLLHRRPSPAINGNPTSLLELLKEEAEVDPQQQRIGALWCHVVRFPSRKTTLWVGMGRRIIVVRKEIREQTGWRIDYRFDGHRCFIADGRKIFLPMMISAEEHHVATPSAQTRIEVIDLEINRLNSEDFPALSATENEKAFPVALERNWREIEPEHLHDLGMWLGTYYRHDPEDNERDSIAAIVLLFAAGTTLGLALRMLAPVWFRARTKAAR